MTIKDGNGKIEWIKLLVPLVLMWCAWITYSSYEVKHLINLDSKLDSKINELRIHTETTLNDKSAILHKRISSEVDEAKNEIRDVRTVVMEIWKLEVSSRNIHGKGK